MYEKANAHPLTLKAITNWTPSLTTTPTPHLVIIPGGLESGWGWARAVGGSWGGGWKIWYKKPKSGQHPEHLGTGPPPSLETCLDQKYTKTNTKPCELARHGLKLWEIEASGLNNISRLFPLIPGSFFIKNLIKTCLGMGGGMGNSCRRVNHTPPPY